MKKAFTCYFPVCLMIACFTSCKEARKKLLPSFNLNIPAISLVLPPIPFVTGKEMPVGALTTHINMDSTIRANTAGTFGAASVTSVRVKKVAIKALNADAHNNLSNFESGRMRLYNDTASVDIVQMTFPKTFAETVTIENEASPDISDYLRGRKLTYNLYWKNRQKTTRRLNIELTVTLSVQ